MNLDKTYIPVSLRIILELAQNKQKQYQEKIAALCVSIDEENIKQLKILLDKKKNSLIWRFFWKSKTIEELIKESHSTNFCKCSKCIFNTKLYICKLQLNEIKQLLQMAQNALKYTNVNEKIYLPFDAFMLLTNEQIITKNIEITKLLEEEEDENE